MDFFCSCSFGFGFGLGLAVFYSNLLVTDSTFTKASPRTPSSEKICKIGVTVDPRVQGDFLTAPNSQIAFRENLFVLDPTDLPRGIATSFLLC
jgi:hypothetical protein